jgi:predicted GIY-YIG superfamily endonuclease
MPAWLYILRLPTALLYVGCTSDLPSRLVAHRLSHGTGDTTRGLRPIALVHIERFDSISSARLREAQLKRWSRAKKEALIAGDFARLHALARCRGARR